MVKNPVKMARIKQQLEAELRAKKEKKKMKKEAKKEKKRARKEEKKRKRREEDGGGKNEHPENNGIIGKEAKKDRGGDSDREQRDYKRRR